MFFLHNLPNPFLQTSTYFVVYNWLSKYCFGKLEIWNSWITLTRWIDMVTESIKQNLIDAECICPRTSKCSFVHIFQFLNLKWSIAGRNCFCPSMCQSDNTTSFKPYQWQKEGVGFKKEKSKPANVWRISSFHIPHVVNWHQLYDLVCSINHCKFSSLFWDHYRTWVL